MTDNDPQNDPIRAARHEVAAPEVRPADTRTPGERPGDVIDRYKLLQEIGEGGMGAVWMAEQREPVTRKVALKIIKLGMDTREVVTRFEAERQAIAMMDHPNICKVLDGGATETGRPYFVMELVRGVPITTYCDDKKLSIDERLELFVQVCHAIQHAHHKGIIHRDIKPTNVMVTMHDGVPVPKVIDFGIAKATSAELTQRTMFTRYEQMIGTPEYMAPEQAEMSGLDIDTRADVYSLGVLLYELLTGTKPFELTEVLQRGYQELLRTIKEEEPAKPSTRVSTLGANATDVAKKRHIEVGKLTGGLRGDLDWIVMKALEKDRTRRYETANGLAADIRRHIDGEPVVAAPPSAAYRLRKFVSRRKGTVVAVAGMTVLLIAGAVGTSIGWLRAADANDRLTAEVVEKEKQRDLAIENAERAEAAEADAQQRVKELDQVASFQEAQLGQLDVEQMGMWLRDAMLGSVEESRKGELAAALEGVNFTDLAQGSLRENLFERTFAAIDEQFDEQPDVRGRLLVAMGETMAKLGLFELAEKAAREALALVPVAKDSKEWAIHAKYSLSYALAGRGDFRESARLALEAVEEARRSFGNDHEVTLGAISAASVALAANGDAAALELLREYHEGVVRLSGPDSLEAVTAEANSLGARVTLGGGEPAELAELEGPMLAFVARHRDNRKYARARSTVLNYLGELYRMLGRKAERVEILQEALDLAEQVRGATHAETVRGRHMLGLAMHDAGQRAASIPVFERYLEDLRAMGRPLVGELVSDILFFYWVERPDPRVREMADRYYEWSQEDGVPAADRAHVQCAYALVLSNQEMERAITLLRDGLAGLDGESTSMVIELANLAYGKRLMREEKYAEAEPYLRAAMKMSARGNSEGFCAEIRMELSAIMMRTERIAGALELMQSILDLWTASGVEFSSDAFAFVGLAVLHEGQGQFERCEPLAKKAVPILRDAGAEVALPLEALQKMLGR